MPRTGTFSAHFSKIIKVTFTFLVFHLVETRRDRMTVLAKKTGGGEEDFQTSSSSQLFFSSTSSPWHSHLKCGGGEGGGGGGSFVTLGPHRTEPSWAERCRSGNPTRLTWQEGRMRRKWGFGGLRLLAISLFHEDSNNIFPYFLCAKIDTLAKWNRNTTHYFRNGPTYSIWKVYAEEGKYC